MCGHEHCNICRVQNVAHAALEVGKLLKSCPGIVCLGIHDINLFSTEQLKLDMANAGLDKCVVG